MNILLTGASGFVGSNICARLADLKYSITGCDDYSFGSPKNDVRDVPRLKMDFNKIDEQTLNQFDLLIHCATSNIIYAQTNEIETFRNNAINTMTLFRRYKGRIIYTSTSSVYHQAKVFPTPETVELHTYNAYDSSKLIAELFLQERGNYTTLRLSNVYGYQQRVTPFSGVVSRMVDAVMHDQPIPINGDGKSTRDYTFVDDVVDAVLQSIEHPALNTELNISTGRETSVLELSEIVCKTLGRPHNVTFIPNRIIDTIQRRCVDGSKAKQLLGWTPKVTLEQGILKAAEWYKHEEK
jgi:UDP-glucose 4-epimerase